MMRFGTINCLCGEAFYFETVNDVVECVYCGEKYKMCDQLSGDDFFKEEQITVSTV